MSTSDFVSEQRQRDWTWVSLAYAGFLFVQPLMEPNRYLWFGSITVFCIFLGIFAGYVRTTAVGEPILFRMVAATFVLGLVTFPWNLGGATFFVYTAVFLPASIESIRRVLWLFLFECMVVLVECGVLSFGSLNGRFHIGWPFSLATVLLLIVIAGSNLILVEQSRADRRLRAALEENVALASVAERERIARDLHDVLGHTLSVVVLKAELAGRLIPLDSARAVAEIGDVERTARAALGEIRDAIAGYRARGLAAEVEAAGRTLNAAGVAFVLEGAPLNCTSLTPKEETAFALALREAVTNIVRHARATTCCVRHATEGGHIRLIIEDNGEHAVAREGNGLRGMRERIESLGGRVSLEAGLENSTGTRLTLELPRREGAVS
jgi:two-component system sensor histidine kinase DesK